MRRLRNLITVTALSIAFLFSCAGDRLKAQGPNPVTPNYQFCIVSGGITKCSSEPVGYDSVTGVTGLPVGVKAVTSCGAESYTNGFPYVLEQDLTGKLCTSIGGSGGTITANQGNAGTNAQAWWTQIGDGTNGPVAVKPVSTPSPATDRSLSVTLNAGSNGIITTGIAGAPSAQVLSEQGVLGGIPLAVSGNGSGATGGIQRGFINCDLHTFLHITSATDTLAVQGVASQIVYVCGATGSGAGTATWALENTASTNANCSSTKAQISGLQSAVAGSSSGFYNPIWGGLKNTSGNGLCVVSTGTGGIDVDVWYAQF